MLYEKKSWWGGQLHFTYPAHSIGSQVSAEGLLSGFEYRLAVGKHKRGLALAKGHSEGGCTKLMSSLSQQSG